jgi:DNA-binding CsgD family transcriptional regulator
MSKRKPPDNRILSVAAFSFLFAYLLSFLFEGQVLYRLLAHYEGDPSAYILAAIVAHLAGLFSCGFMVHSPRAARYVMLGGMGVCLIGTVPFFFAPSALWFAGLVISGYAGGCAVAAWGYCLKTFTPKNSRIKSCADVLIVSNIIMIAINVIAVHLSPFAGLALSMLCLVIGAAFVWAIPFGEKTLQSEPAHKAAGDLRKPLFMLVLFIAIITINSGLMYQVINPAFARLTWLASWYWAVPYILALLVMRNLSGRIKRAHILYVGMAMIMAAFLCFMLLGRDALDYILVDTLMLGACGIFDLFWWSIIGEMLDYARNPVKIFGIGLAANVFGVLLGDVVGVGVTSADLPGAEVTVIALTVVCVTLVILPPLNRQLVMLLKNHAYLVAYSGMTGKQQSAIIKKTKLLDPLTEREGEVLKLILTGKSNREIADELYISENTVKTHARNIYSKYDVGSRAELISTLLKNQTDA